MELLISNCAGRRRLNLSREKTGHDIYPDHVHMGGKGVDEQK